jgi:hypothetical protein
MVHLKKANLVLATTLEPAKASQNYLRTQKETEFLDK